MSTETKATHTPGPWRADWDDNGYWYIEPLRITGAKLRGDSEDCVESANARLIAAAPELLAALESIRTLTTYVMCVPPESGLPGRVFAIADAAIAKAEGRG